MRTGSIFAILLLTSSHVWAGDSDRKDRPAPPPPKPVDSAGIVGIVRTTPPPPPRKKPDKKTKKADKKNQEQAGILAILGSGDASLFGRDDGASGGLIGNQIGEAYGVGGLGLKGVGVRGGGAGQGIGSIGTGGHGTVAGSPTMVGNLDKNAIRRVVHMHLAAIRYCYEKELNNDPGLAGRVVLSFTIGPDGGVTESAIASTTLASDAVESCMIRQVGYWKFPQPAGGGLVKVSYPFEFKSAE